MRKDGFASANRTVIDSPKTIVTRRLRHKYDAASCNINVQAPSSDSFENFTPVVAAYKMDENQIDEKDHPRANLL